MKKTEFDYVRDLPEEYIEWWMKIMYESAKSRFTGILCFDDELDVKLDDK